MRLSGARFRAEQKKERQAPPCDARPYHALAARTAFRDRKFISKIKEKRFYLGGPLDLVVGAWGRWPPRKIVANWLRSNDSMLHASRLGAHEDNLELLLDDDLIVDAG